MGIIASFLKIINKPRNSEAYLLVVISALLYAVSFTVPSLWFCSLFFLIPLYYASLKFDIRARHGFVWGLVAYSILFSFLICVLLEYGQGVWRLLCFPLFVVYGACSTAIWFYAATRCTTRQVYAWLISSAAYFWWVDSKMLIIFGLFQGVPFFFPLLPLISKVTLLWSLPVISKYGLFVIVCLNSMLTARWFSTFRAVYIGNVIGIYFLFFWL